LRNSLDLRSARAIAKLLQEADIELLHTHVGRDYTVAAMAARLAGVPFVLTRHVLFPMSRMHKLLLRDVRFVIAPSAAVAEALREQAIFAAEKLVTVRHGLDPAEYPVRPYRDAGEYLTVGSVGNLDPVKGFDILIRSASRVTKILPGIRFRITGDDRSKDRGNENSLRELIAELDLQDIVDLAGPSDDIPKTLAGFDIFVSASRSESFGYAIAEAMLSGIPAIASATKGAAEIVATAAAGVLVPVGSPDALAEAIVALAGDPEKRKALGIAGRAHSKQNFSIERMIEETESVYRRAVEGR
jgi:glycosyltransferase involved in cell wall biosynthesis